MTNKNQAENLLENIHCEDYADKYRRSVLNHRTMIYSDFRARESLNGLWHFTADQYDTGLRADWHVFEPKDKGGRRLPWDYDPLGGELITVPSCWNLFREKYYYYEGNVWYAKNFSYQPDTPGERVFLRIGAANYETKIFLNQKFLGCHSGGSTPFFVELTAELQSQNTIQFCVDNTRTGDRVPMKNTDWFNYGGVYRDVELIRLPQNFIREFFVSLVPDGMFRTIQVWIKADKPDAAGEVVIEIPELHVRETGNLQNGACEFRIVAGPELWRPDNPKLYEVRARYQQDRVTDWVGFREIRTEGQKIVLNGKEIFLRGICVHEDDPELGKSSDEADIRRRFADAKELGCNFMRLAHYPHTEKASQIADEIGMLLWEEIPVYWAIDFDNPATYEDAENQLTELIQRDRNRASVIIWSVGNENADTDERLSFMSRLARTAKTLDPTRLVSAACLVNHVKNKIEDRLIDYLDVIGINEYYGWYYPNFDELVAFGENSSPSKPVIITETGADGLAGFHSSKTDMFSEEFMEDVYLKQVAILRKLRYVKGISPWILYDFRTPRRCNRYQQGYNRKGLIAADKTTRKLSFYVLQRFYREMAAEGKGVESGAGSKG